MKYESRAVRFAPPLALALLQPVSAQAAIDMFLLVKDSEGADIAGRSEDSAYKSSIDVLASS